MPLAATFDILDDLTQTIIHLVSDPLPFLNALSHRAIADQTMYEDSGKECWLAVLDEIFQVKQ